MPVRKTLLTLAVFLLITNVLQAQNLRFSGNINDTTGSQPLPNALMMAVKFNDSSLVAFSRSDKKGIFKPFTIAPDTYIVIITHPLFSDKTYLLVPGPSDTAFNFKNVMLPPKSLEIKEVEVLAYREKSYYKGDTLIFTADSFKTRANATVEDLLKRLPGFRVDVSGKITVQGREVDQVLVDGDEFFGTDPTVATRNLNATTIKDVQVYDKKNENTEEGAEETVKVINLKLKEDAKKGYFGKASAAGDFNRFYENELLANKFKGTQKMSVFGLLANTPKQAFNYGDIDRYGLSGEQPWSYDEESGTWTSQGQNGKGVPRTIKAGAYFNDKLGENTKINADYTFNQNRLFSGTETNTQFFLEDTTYTNFKKTSNTGKNESHAANLRLTSKLDSLTELTVRPRIRYSAQENDNVQTDDFISQNQITTRRTVLHNLTSNQSLDINTQFSLKRNFRKKDRSVTLHYQPMYNKYDARTNLKTGFQYFTAELPDSSLDQERTQANKRVEHNASVTYVEPWTKKLKSEFNYNFSHNNSTTNRQTYDLFPAGNDIFNPVLSNHFDNLRLINRTGTKLIYDVKKFRISAGVQLRNVAQQNTNVTTGQKLYLNVNNILPNAMFVYRINQGSNLHLRYNSSSQQPDLQQMQPVVDNSDPNRISLGNPDLRPNFSNNVNFNYWFYKGISDVNFWSGASINVVDDAFSSSTDFDAQGRAVTRPVNVDGNYFGNMWMGGGFPVLKRFMKVYLRLNASHNNNVSYINGTRAVSQNSSIGPNITFEKSVEKFEARISGNYDYNVPKTNLSTSSQQPYYTYKIEGNFEIKLPAKFSITGQGEYVNNGNRTPGYNLNYFILNGSLNKNFLKAENLVVSFLANDILNQNISNERFISTNQIVDRKTQIIRRYFLLRVLYKFNSQKTKQEEEDDY